MDFGSDDDFDPLQIYPICGESPAKSYAEYCDRIKAKFFPPKGETTAEIGKENELKSTENETVAENNVSNKNGEIGTFGSDVVTTKIKMPTGMKQTNSNLKPKRGKKRKFDDCSPSTSKRGPRNNDQNDSCVVKRDIPIGQRQKIPSLKPYKIFGDRRSNLTKKQNEIHNASMLNFQRTGSLQSESNLKEFKERKKVLENENRIFNQILKEEATKDQRKYRYATKRMKNFVEHSMVLKKSEFDHFPAKYEKIDEIKIDVSLTSPQLPELEFKQLLTESMIKPCRIVLPNLEKLCTLPPANSVDRKTSFIINDKTIEPFVEKFVPSFIMTCSSAKTLFTSFGPLDTSSWTLPVQVESKFIQGQKRKLVYVLKPLPPQTLDNMQITWYNMKHSLKILLLKKSHKDSLRQYSYWKLKHYGIVIRSNVDGEYKLEDRKVKMLGKDVHASFLPKVDYQWEYGGEMLRREEALHHWWTAFLKRSLVHLRFRISPYGSQNPFVLAVEELQAETYFKLHTLNSDLRKDVGDGMHNASQVLERLLDLDDGFYLIRSDSDKSTIGVYRESTNAEKFEIDLQSDWFRDCNDILDTRSLWMPINPECVLQWHRIKKRVPATFEPREDNEEPKLTATKKKKQKKRSKVLKIKDAEKTVSLDPKTSQNEHGSAADDPDEIEFM